MDNNKEKETAKLDLSLKEEIKDRTSEFQREYLKEEIDSLPPIKVGELTFDGIYTYDMGDKVEVYLYIRNGFKVPARLEGIKFMISNSKKEILAVQRFDMSYLGYIPSMGARPVKIYFDKKNVFVDNIPKDGWKIGIAPNAITKTVSDIKFDDLPGEYSYEKKQQFLKYVEKMPALESGKTDINAYEVYITPNKSLLATLIIRNALDEKFKLNNLYMEVKDELGDLIVKGEFDLKDKNIVIDPEHGILYNFIFKQESFLKDKFDLTNCSVIVKYNY